MPPSSTILNFEVILHMILAGEAKYVSNEVNESNASAQLNRLENEILSVARAGSYSLVWTEDLYESVRSELEYSGYSIQENWVLREVTNENGDTIYTFTDGEGAEYIVAAITINGSLSYGYVKEEVVDDETIFVFHFVSLDDSGISPLYRESQNGWIISWENADSIQYDESESSEEDDESEEIVDEETSSVDESLTVVSEEE